MDTLTKENFWDEMEQRYPKAMAHFKEWIDRYKSEHNWEQLFNHGAFMSGKIYPNPHKVVAPKYHELPIAMQFGIFLEWIQQFSNQRFRVSLFERKELEGYTLAYKISFLAIVKASITRALIKMEEEL